MCVWCVDAIVHRPLPIAYMVFVELIERVFRSNKMRKIEKNVWIVHSYTENRFIFSKLHPATSNEFHDFSIKQSIARRICESDVRCATICWKSFPSVPSTLNIARQSWLSWHMPIGTSCCFNQSHSVQLIIEWLMLRMRRKFPTSNYICD